MRILIDECIDERFRKSFPSHECQTARFAGLAGLKNGELLDAAETAKFDVLLTVDQRLEYQQTWPAEELPSSFFILDRTAYGICRRWSPLAWSASNPSNPARLLESKVSRFVSMGTSCLSACARVRALPGWGSRQRLEPHLASLASTPSSRRQEACLRFSPAVPVATSRCR